MQVATAIIVTIKASNSLLNSGTVGVGEADAAKVGDTEVDDGEAVGLSVGVEEADVVLTYTFPVPAATKPLSVIVK